MAKWHGPSFEEGIFHVTSRGNAGRTLFDSDQDVAIFFDILGEYKRKLNFSLYAYCLMPNHLHLLLRVFACPLSRIMHDVLMCYARRYNKERGLRGHVFEDNYYPVLCQRDEQFMELVRYIHLNPVRAGLAAVPGDWAWSSWRALVEAEEALLVDAEFVRGIFGGEPPLACVALRTFVLGGLPRPREEERIYAARSESTPLS